MKYLNQYNNPFYRNICRFRQRIPGFYRDLKEALSGSEADYTEVKLSRALWLLSVPMVLEVLMESVFSVVDIFFVSSIGADAVATVGLTESMLTIVYAIGFGISTATTALVSRRIGEKERDKASHVAFQAILTALGASLLISIPGICCPKILLSLMGANDRIINEMSAYTAIMISGNVVIMMLFTINAVFRSAGDAAVSMKVLWMANLVNLVLDPLLIFGWGPVPAFGVKGAAIATTTGRGIAVLYQVYLLSRGRGRISLQRRHLTPDLAVIGQLIRLSMGAIGQNLISTSSWILLMRIISVFGSQVLAGYTIAIRVVLFVLFPSWGLSNAASTLVGQNLGANKPDRAEKSVWAAGKMNMIFLGAVGIVFIAFPEIFIGIFSSDRTIVDNGATALRIISMGFIFYGLGMVLMNAINGAGDTATPTKFNLLCFWIVEVPLAYLLALRIEWAEKGVFYAIVIAESLLCLVALQWFRQGKWKTKMI